MAEQSVTNYEEDSGQIVPAGADVPARTTAIPERIGERAHGRADLPAGPSGAETDSRLIELWLHSKSATTQRAYENDLAKLFDFTGGKPLASVTLADLQEFSDLLGEALAGEPGEDHRRTEVLVLFRPRGRLPPLRGDQTPEGPTPQGHPGRETALRLRGP